MLIFFVNFGHLTWLWRHHKIFHKNWFLPLVSPRSDFLWRKWFFRNIQLRSFRMICHMTTLNHFGAKWSFWPLIAKMTIILTSIRKFYSNACFWVLQITCFLLIYRKPYEGSKFKIRISKSIGRFCLTRCPGHVTRKQKN